ncbi:nickel ABC transporter permease subunit NikC, partial [Methylobacterium frigidaeris]
MTPAGAPARSRSVAIAGLLAAGFVLLALLGSLVVPHDPLAVDLAHRFEAPTLAHLLGTDHLGRDILSRLIAGARTTLGSVLVVLALVLALGLSVGGLSGMLGGRIDAVLMRLCDVFL